ncbi:MAG: UDP-N-acetylmuramoyl-tripeptide--D-alanyl-D-alanine ligase [Rikenellaceae bacterium]
MSIKELYELFKLHPHISTDSRNVVKGAIYFALRGDKFDGNRYAAVAIDGGAVAAVVDRAEVAQAAKYGERMIVVDDVLTTLQQLAAHHRKELGIKIFAITGSNGKTTTKELTAAVLAQKYRVYATRGNLNNHIGVPLTLLSMDSSTELGVVEMGASSCGEIALLCSIAQPDYGVVTNIGRAHLDGFGGAEGVKRGKGELLDWLDRSGGVLFIASENEILNEMVAERPTLQGLSFSYSLADGLKHNLEGDYNSYNIAAAVAIGSHFGVDEAAIKAAIAAYRPTNNRSQLYDTERNRLILDCYNANPSSMEVALNNFDEEEFVTNGDKVLILGDMRELGSWSTEEHQRIIESCTASNAKRIIFVGEEFRKASATASAIDPRIELYESCNELKGELSERAISGCTILIKGSRGISLEQIVTLL